MKTAFKSYVSPYQVNKGKVVEHPVKSEVSKSLGEIQFNAVFTEDKHSLDTLKVQNVVAFLCTLWQGQRIIAEGRGMSILGKTSRWVQKSIQSAKNASLIDAVSKGTRVLEALQPDSRPSANSIVGTAYKADLEETEEPITDRQKSYLTELISMNIEDDNERERWMAQVPTMSRTDASDAIQSLLPDRE